MSYPLSKDLAGNAAWRNMHHRASLYSDNNPTPKERERMKYFLYESMNSVAQLCKNCKKDIKDYLRKHPLDSALGGKRQLSRYLCEFHNHVNEKTGKEIHNCHNIVSGKPGVCTDCEKAVAADSQPISVKESLESFKDISAKVFKALCNKYKIPIPNIKFHHCPDSPETSCASMLVDNTTNEIVEKPTIYLHPNVYGLRTIFHEFIHYAKQLKKDTLGTLDELTVERETQELLNEEFPFDKVEINKEREIIMAPKVVVKDTFTSRLHNFPRASQIYQKHLRNTRRHDFPVSNGESGDWIFDMVNDIKSKNQELEREEEAYQKVKEEQHNALSFLDGIYAPFAKILGLKPHDLNRNNSPIVISNAALTLVKSNMTPLGGLLVSTLSSIGMFAALVAGKDNIGYGDRVLLNSFGSNLFWSGLDYMRPDNKQEVVEQAVTLGHVVSAQKWNLIPELLIDSPFFASSLASDTDTTSSASPLSGRRGVQRAAGGATRGATGGVGGRTSSSAKAAAVDQAIAEERYIAGLRNQQRLTPGGVTAPAAPYTRDVPTGAAAGNPSGKGGSVIGKEPVGGSGVVGTDYMNNTVIIPDEFGEYDDAVVESQFGAKVASSDYGGYYGEMRGPREDFIELEPPETKRNTIREIYFQGDDELGMY
jgi:hypothetical protein